MTSIGTLIVYLLLGKLTIFILQEFPFIKVPLLGKLFEDGKFLYRLFSCDLCLGVWTYTVLAFLFQVNFLSEWFYVPVLSELFTGIMSSFVMHLVSIGWKDRFGQFIVR